MTEFGQELLDFGGELAGFADALERGVRRDLSGLHAEELSALELAATRGALGVDGAGAGAMIERRAGLVDPRATSEQGRFVAGFRADISEEDAVAAKTALQAERVRERSHFNSMTTGQ